MIGFFTEGTWISCTAPNKKGSSVLTTFFPLPLYERGIDDFRKKLDPDGNHPLVNEVQSHVETTTARV